MVRHSVKESLCLTFPQFPCAIEKSLQTFW